MCVGKKSDVPQDRLHAPLHFPKISDLHQDKTLKGRNTIDAMRSRQFYTICLCCCQFNHKRKEDRKTSWIRDKQIAERKHRNRVNRRWWQPLSFKKIPRKYTLLNALRPFQVSRQSFATEWEKVSKKIGVVRSYHCYVSTGPVNWNLNLLTIKKKALIRNHRPVADLDKFWTWPSQFLHFHVVSRKIWSNNRLTPLLQILDPSLLTLQRTMTASQEKVHVPWQQV